MSEADMSKYLDALQQVQIHQQPQLDSKKSNVSSNNGCHQLGKAIDMTFRNADVHQL